MRIKVTGRCNRECFFCHAEGGVRNAEDITWTPELEDFLAKTSQAFNIKNISLTGGEPLLHDGLMDFVAKIHESGHFESFSLTTNGTIDKGKSFWKELRAYGLNKVSLSISDILEEKYHNNQVKLLSILNDLDIKASVNVVVYNDAMYTKSVIRRLFEINWQYNFKVVLLPNLLNYDFSKRVIDQICTDFECELVGVRTPKNSSNRLHHYRTKADNDLYVKTTKEDKKAITLDGFCDSCKVKDSCQEGFYGLRIEQAEGIHYVRGCIHKSDKETVIPIKDFSQSSLYKTLERNYNKEE